MVDRDEEWTESIHRKLCEALRCGAKYEQAARYAGVRPKTLWRWRNHGKRAKWGQCPLKDEPYWQRCLTIFEDTEKARMSYELGSLAQIGQSPDWKAAQWKLMQLTGADRASASSRQSKKRKSHDL